MDKFLKFSITLGILVVVITFFIPVGIYQHLLFTYTDYRVIKSIEAYDKFSELYIIKNGKIVNNVRENYVFPDDGLQYQLTIFNSLNEDTKASFHLEVFKGGEMESEEFGEWSLLSQTDNQKEVIFFVKEAGSYDVKLNLLFYYYDNDTSYAQYINWENIQVQSLIDKLQADANQINFYALVIASVVGGGTVFSLIWNIFQSRKEVGILGDQNKILATQQRPWIGRENRPDNIVVKQGNPDLLHIHLHNYGSSPALRVVTRSFVDLNQPPPNPFDLTTPSNEFALTPNERFSHRIVITPQEFQAFLNGVLHYGLRVTYTDNNQINGVYEIRGHFERGTDIFDDVIIT